jgi:hypothetical protein
MGNMWLYGILLLVISCARIESASLPALPPTAVSKFPILPRPSVPKGIPNLAMTCFFNSLLQSLYNTTFIERLHEMYKKDELKKAPLCNELHKFFTRFRTQEKITADDVRELYNYLRTYKGEYGPILKEDSCMQDPGHVFRHFYPFLKSEFEIASEPFPFDLRIVRYNEATGKLIKKTSEEASQASIRLIQPLSEARLESVDRGIEAYFSVMERPKEHYKYKRKIENLPEILVISIDIAQAVPFSLTLLLKNDYLDSNIKNKSATYNIRSIALYRPKGGRHYTASFSYDVQSSKWYFINDASVREIPQDRINALGTTGFFIDEGGTGTYYPRLLMYQRVGGSQATSTSPQSELSQLSAQLHTLSTQF